MPTLKEVICEQLSKAGVQAATGVKISYPDGTSFTIHSDDHAALSRPVEASRQPKVEPVQSAQGGN